MNEFQKKVFNTLLWLVVVPLDIYIWYLLCDAFIPFRDDIMIMGKILASAFVAALGQFALFVIGKLIWDYIIKPFREAYKRS